MVAVGSYDNPEAYIAEDRRRALSSGAELPERTQGSALFADISGFTPLTEALVAELGPQRGAEELSAIVDTLFDQLLARLHRHGGSVVYFSGDAVTCWLQDDDGSLAASCALDMQRTMVTAGRISTPSGRTVELAMKIAIVVGAARRFVVGDPAVQLIDVLAGALMDDLAATERIARPGQILLDAPAADLLADRVHGEPVITDGIRRLRLTGLTADLELPPPAPDNPPLPEEIVRSWLLQVVYERMKTGRGEFLAELRTAVPLFLRFGGLDFDNDPAAVRHLDDFIVAAQHVIDGYGGSTLQLTIGDKGAYLYAVFGAPHAHEDDAARAAAAALDLLDLEAGHAVTGFQIGLSLGRLRSGTYGHAQRRTFCCLGDPVNLAARLMAAASPGQILVSGDVQAAAGQRYRWEQLTDRRLKGKSAAVTPYALLGVNHAVAALARAPASAAGPRRAARAGGDGDRGRRGRDRPGPHGDRIGRPGQVAVDH